MGSDKTGDMNFYGPVTITGGQVGTGDQHQDVPAGAPPAAGAPAAAPEPPPTEPPPRPADLPPARSRHAWDVFIAHASADKPAARQLFDLLAPHCRPFLDAACIEYGDDWDRVIARAQRESLVTVVLVSRGTQAAYYAREEIAAAIALAREPASTHRVVPVHLEPALADVPYGLRIKHGIMAPNVGGIPGVAREIQRLVGRLVGRGDPGTGPSPRDLPGWTAWERVVRNRAERLPSCLGSPEPGVHLVDLYVELELSQRGERMLEPGARPRRLDEVLAGEGLRWSVSGQPGSGKSTALQVTASRLLASGSAVPVLLTVTDLARAGGLVAAVEVTAREVVGEALADKAVAVVTAACEAGEAVILLDGLDEEPDTDAAHRAIDRAVAAAGGCRMVVAGRPVAFEERDLTSDFQPLRLMPLDDTWAEELLRKRLGDKDWSEELVLGLRRARQAAVLDNPLLLALLAELARGAGRGVPLPGRRVDLYDRLVPFLVDPRHRTATGDRQPARFDNPAAARRLLEEVALAVHRTGGNRVPAADVEAALARAGCDEAAAFLARATDVTGLVHVVDTVSGSFVVFTHRTLREFLAATALVRRLRATGLDGAHGAAVLSRAFADPTPWAEVLALVAGLLSRPAAPGPPQDWPVRLWAWLRGIVLPPPPTDADLLRSLVDRAVTASSPLAFRIVADAEGLAADTILAVLGVDGRREAWEKRMEVLQRLPELAGDPLVAARLVLRFLHATRTTHGADLFWAREVLRRIFEGDVELPEAPADAQAALAEASHALEHLYDHFENDQANRERAWALLEPWWRFVPPEDRPPPDVFTMGSTAETDPDRFGWEWPAHRVEVVARYRVCAVPVTNQVYECFDPGHRVDRTDFAGAAEQAAKVWRDNGYDPGEVRGEKLPVDRQDNCPVYRVTWYEAVAFCQWLGEGARLPTETEWEHFCRAGSTTRFHAGDGDDDLLRVGRVLANSGGHPWPVAGQPANAWGLHDLHGNVWEWCVDAAENPQEGATPEDRSCDPGRPPVAGDPSAGRVVRGGSWYVHPRGARSAFRGGNLPTGRVDGLGFRLLLPPWPPSPSR